ncbi:MAG: hypothetical protein U9R05_06565, partial [Chloroflexota bacterium]|nr:hypothetical protein [Chloroflexota bacterium]
MNNPDTSMDYFLEGSVRNLCVLWALPAHTASVVKFLFFCYCSSVIDLGGLKLLTPVPGSQPGGQRPVKIRAAAQSQ